MSKISNKIIFLALIPTVIVGTAVGIMLVYLTTSSDSSSLYAYEQTMRNDFDTTARWETETVRTMLDALTNKYFRGEITLDSAKSAGAELIRNIKYGQEGYFWVDRTDGVNIVSSVRSHEGTNRMHLFLMKQR